MKAFFQPSEQLPTLHMFRTPVGIAAQRLQWALTLTPGDDKPPMPLSQGGASGGARGSRVPPGPIKQPQHGRGRGARRANSQGLNSKPSRGAAAPGARVRVPGLTPRQFASSGWLRGCCAGAVRTAALISGISGVQSRVHIRFIYKEPCRCPDV